MNRLLLLKDKSKTFNIEFIKYFHSYYSQLLLTLNIKNLVTIAKCIELMINLNQDRYKNEFKKNVEGMERNNIEQVKQFPG